MLYLVVIIRYRKLLMHNKLVAVRMLKKILIKQKRFEKILFEKMHNKLEAVRLLKKIRIQQRLLAEKQENFAQAQKILLEKIDIATKELIKYETEIAAPVPNNGSLTKKRKTNVMEARRRLRRLMDEDEFSLILHTIPYCRNRRP
ncbi:unnamed protein product [Microthlaspi erraticum]|uniref:Uncharacterized protein n=1 Tax=Microthlaspi erraticum TaxID=1685480 RepID=A0A6D2KKQ0_9BRAS|nr:unnamed protein product [Microthlaspi erraticum]